MIFCTDMPSQKPPPLRGAGLVQVRDRFWTPRPHGTLQADHSVHRDQPPFTGEFNKVKGERKVYWSILTHVTSAELWRGKITIIAEFEWNDAQTLEHNDSTATVLEPWLPLSCHCQKKVFYYWNEIKMWKWAKAKKTAIKRNWHFLSRNWCTLVHR